MEVDLSSSWPSFVVLQLKEGLEILQSVVERIESRYFIVFLVTMLYALSAAKLLIVVTVTL